MYGLCASERLILYIIEHLCLCSIDEDTEAQSFVPCIDTQPRSLGGGGLGQMPVPLRALHQPSSLPLCSLPHTGPCFYETHSSFHSPSSVAIVRSFPRWSGLFIHAPSRYFVNLNIYMQTALYVLKFSDDEDRQDLTVFKVCGLVGRTTKMMYCHKIRDSDKHKKETSGSGDVGFWYHYN